MDQDELLRKAKEKGFASIDDFAKANLHHLPEEKQKLLCSIMEIEKILKKEKDKQSDGKG